MSELSDIKKTNLAHAELIKSNTYALHMSRVERQAVLDRHKNLIKSKRSLLGRLLVLSNSDLNADLNGDIDDQLEE